MLAFAANSIFNRLSLAEGEIGPSGFALIRTLSAALILLLLVALRPKRDDEKPKMNIASTLSLTIYILGFSFAYISLDTGIGALILFGGVQITMFIGALYKRERISNQRWLGSLIAVVGMVWLLAPSDEELPVIEALLMGAAAIGWGCYSLIGRRASNPLLETQRSFIFSIPLVALV